MAPSRETITRKFWERVEPEPMSGCWLWIGGLTDCNYGHVKWRGVFTGAHRVAYELSVGAIPATLQLDHLCRNTRCVNPRHLEPVTGRENLLRGTGFIADNARKTTCPKGHPYDAVVWSRRVCMACRREQDKLRKRGYRRLRSVEDVRRGLGL